MPHGKRTHWWSRAASLQALLWSRRGNDSTWEEKDLLMWDQLWAHHSRLNCPPALWNATCFCALQLSAPTLAKDAILLVRLFCGRRGQWCGGIGGTSKQDYFPSKCPEVQEWHINPLSWADTGLHDLGQGQVVFNKSLGCVATSDLCSGIFLWGSSDFLCACY